MHLRIGNFRFCDRIVTSYPEWEANCLEYHFHFSGEHQTEHFSLGAGQFAVSGSGSVPKETFDALDTQPYLEVIINIKPDTLHSFIGDSAGELPPELQPLIRPSDQEQYCRTGTAGPAMQTVARRIIQCPYQGIGKRLYLEGKALELLGLLVTQEVEIRDGTIPSHFPKPYVVDRIHHARDILLQRLDNPPSLLELARQVGLNEYLLKPGFRQVFGTTAFGYLRDHRLEQARKLLETAIYSVEEVAHIVGYQLEHQFGDNWSLQNVFRARIQKTKPGNEFYPTFDGLGPDNRTLDRTAIDNTVDYNDYDLSTYLTGKFSTGSIDHQLLLGVDLSRSYLGYERFSAPPPLDVFNPVYGRVSGPFTFAFDGEQLTDALGIYIQDQVTLATNLKLLLGGRFDLFEQTSRFDVNPEES